MTPREGKSGGRPVVCTSRFDLHKIPFRSFRGFFVTRRFEVSALTNGLTGTNWMLRREERRRVRPAPCRAEPASHPPREEHGEGVRGLDLLYRRDSQNAYHTCDIRSPRIV